jgi:UDP-N-acetylglucosamine transferase subunit ALG13
MNVFITIGTQDPFDRLIRIVDELVPELPGVHITAQAITSTYRVKNIKTETFIPAEEFSKFILDADIVISHAGIGTILNVLEAGKPFVVFPRDDRFHETRDDHQIATCEALSKLGYVEVARTREELKEKILHYKNNVQKLQPRIGSFASAELLRSLEEYILQ